MKTPRYADQTIPRFIVVEGLDGAGTSTQSALLARNLELKGLRVSNSCEPTPGPVGTLIKQLMRGRLRFSDNRRNTDRMLAHLFAADRHDHLYNETDGILVQASAGTICISTRYFFSSYAYNAQTEEDFDLVQRLNQDFPLPQAVVYLTVPLEVSLQRLQGREVREFYEREEELRRVADNYERVLSPISDRVVRAESVGDPQVIASRVSEEIFKLLTAP